MRYFILLLALLPGAAAAEEAKLTRDESLINAFQIMCFLEPALVYDRIDTRAAAMRMVTMRVQAPTEANGIAARGHIWGGHLTDGPFVLHLYEQRHAGEAATSCGVSGPVAAADTFRDDMVRVMRMPPLPAATVGADGSRAYIWNDYLAANHRLILRSLVGPDGKTSVMITLSEKAGV